MTNIQQQEIENTSNHGNTIQPPSTTMDQSDKEIINGKTNHLPEWTYDAMTTSKVTESTVTVDNNMSKSTTLLSNLAKSMKSIHLGSYQRPFVSNLNAPIGKQLFDVGLQFMMSYHHELAAQYFWACLQICPNAALAYGLLSLCHSPNYNFSDFVYYTSSNRPNEEHAPDSECYYPSQYVANRNSMKAISVMEELQQVTDMTYDGVSTPPFGTRVRISDMETQFLFAIRILTCQPGIDPMHSKEKVGRPYAMAMKQIYQNFPNDPDIAYFYVESLMVLNAWKLYDYPSNEPLSPDVDEIQYVLEHMISIYPNHPGLCHLYVHFCEMSSHPNRAMTSCDVLRVQIPHAGHLIHMPTHIDVLLGDYDKCVKYNLHAIDADMKLMEVFPSTSERHTFYFGYIVHDFHMAVYGAILGGMEKIAIKVANDLNVMLNESLIVQFPHVIPYLEAYSALDVHVMIRFGHWKELLQLEMPHDTTAMLYRASSIRYGRALAYAMTGNIELAKEEADKFDLLRQQPEASQRVLHNNTVASLLAIDATMMRGEIAYRDGQYQDGLELLRQAVQMEDALNYDEPWGKMQPIRHALGGLLMEQNELYEAEQVFRKDLQLHPRNPWALVGLIRCLGLKVQDSCCINSNGSTEIHELQEQLRVQRKMEWADYNIVVPCECCAHPIE